MINVFNNVYTELTKKGDMKRRLPRKYKKLLKKLSVRFNLLWSVSNVTFTILNFIMLLLN